jgi:hypothetical protein
MKEDERIKISDEERMRIYNSGFSEGIKHSEPSPDTVRMHDAMKMEVAVFSDEWATFKKGAFRILVTLLCGFSGAFVGYGVWVGNISTTVSSTVKDVENLEKRATKTEDKQQLAAENAARLGSDLAAVKEIVLDIKNGMKIK